MKGFRSSIGIILITILANRSLAVVPSSTSLEETPSQIEKVTPSPLNQQERMEEITIRLERDEHHLNMVLQNMEEHEKRIKILEEHMKPTPSSSPQPEDHHDGHNLH